MWRPLLTVLIVLLVLLQAHSQTTDGVTLSLRGVTYASHDLVTTEDVGEGVDGLTATTTRRPCCESAGSWFQPGSTTQVPEDSTLIFYQSRTSEGQLVLNRRGYIDGLFTCTIPNASGVDVSLYIGVYPPNSGAPAVTSLTYNPTSRTLTCTSSDGPATNVIWRRNCSPLTGSAHTTSQMVSDTALATYESTLTLSQVVDGCYSCSVENRRGRSSRFTSVGSAVPFTVTFTSGATPTAGQRLTLTCSHNSTDTTSPVSYEWLDRNGTILHNASTLTFDPLRESDRELYCVVTIGAQVGCGEIYMNVEVPSFSVSINDVSGEVLSTISLACALANPPPNAMVMYKFYKGGSPISDPSTSQIYTINRAQLSDAGGDYRCQALITLDYLDLSSPLIVDSTTSATLSLTIPPPTTTISVPAPDVPYSGSSGVIQCAVNNRGLEITGPTANITLFRVSGSQRTEVGTTSRITAGNVVEVAPGVFTRMYTYSVLSRQDDAGEYSCDGTVLPVDSSVRQFVTNGMATDDFMFTIVDPTLVVEVSMVTERILDIPPYNTFTLTCSASSSVQGQSFAITKTLGWSESVDGASPTNLTQDVTTSDLAQITSSSAADVTVTSAGEYVYRCESVLTLGAIPDRVVGVASTNVTVHGPSPPAAPTSLSVIQVNHRSAIIQWTVAMVTYDNESYIVMYGNDSNNLVYSSARVEGQSRLSGLRYSVEIRGLQSLTLYYYRVQAINSQGHMESELASFNTTAVVPSAPVSLRYTRATPTDHTFYWLPPNDTNITVSQYRLTCEVVLRLGIAQPNLILVTMTTSVSAVLAPWTNYSCSVVASNDNGLSPPSNLIAFSTPETLPTGPPRQFDAMSNPTLGNITFFWATPAPNLTNGEIIKYSLKCIAGSEVVSMVFPPSSDNEYTASGFSALTEYTCNVSAVNGAGAGPPETKLFTSGEDVPGAPPMDFMYEIVSATVINFSWTPPPADQRNGMLTMYHLECAVTPGDSSLKRSQLELTGTLSGFTAARRYSCQVRAATAPGAGPPATLTVVTLPSVPSGVGVSALSSRQVNVTWTISSEDVISEYIVYVNGTEVGRTQGSEFVVMERSPFTMYTISVSAVNDAGEGERSSGQSVTTLEDLPGRVACSSRWNSSTSTSITVNWAPPTPENGVTLAYHLRLVRHDSPSRTLAQVNVTSDVQQVTLTPPTPLQDGVPYRVEVLAENSVGRGTLPCLSIDFNVQLVPPSPTNVIVARSTAGDNLTVTWDVPTLTQARGFVTYTVTFEPSISNRKKRQSILGECTMSPCVVPVKQGGVVIVNVDPATTYDITVTPSNENSQPGDSTTATSQAVTTTPTLDIAVIAGAAGGTAGVVLVLILLLIVILCCLRCHSRKGGYDPEPSYALEDYGSGSSESKNIYGANIPSPASSSGTTSPRRELTSPLHMSEKDFLLPVELAEFSDFVAHMRQGRNKGFERAFNSLPKDGLESCDAARRNDKKNRFRNVYPYDVSRVRLEVVGADQHSDYINASYVDGYNKSRMYIAAQAPMQNTISDFWRMIWEQRLAQVVMLSHGKEGKAKVDKYWPSELHQEHNTPFLKIVCNEVTLYADFEIRKFFVTNMVDPDDQGLVVTHYLFTGWPDHGVPEYATALIGFIRRVKAHYKPEAPPLLVHCLAGVGRTGVFIVLDIMLERLKEQSTVNVYEALRDIRLKRANMVQTQEQFVFVHDALNDLILCGDTELPARGFRERVHALHKIRPGGEHVSEFNYQFMLLDKVSPKQPQLQEALQHYNVHKNRYQDKIPNANSFVILDHTGTPGGEYINASFVNGYKQRRAYIATQAPLEDTVEDFWSMVWKFESRAIVMLCSLIEEKKEVCSQYWPTDVERPMKCGKLWIKMMEDEEIGEGLVKRKFMLSEDSTFAPEYPRLSVHQFHYTMWPEQDRPQTTDQVRKILDEVDRVQRSTSNKPITVMCNDGMGRTGAFIAIHSQWERVKTEGMADLFQFVKSARVHRSNLIIDLEHYIFCHDTLADYVDTFETSDYANFK